MRRRRGAEGQAPSEKSTRLIAPGYRKEKRKREQAEEQEWAARSGPVVTTKPGQ